MNVNISFKCVTVGDPKRVFSLREGMAPLLVWTQAITTLGDFVTLWLIRGCASGPVTGLSARTSSERPNTLRTKHLDR